MSQTEHTNNNATSDSQMQKWQDFISRNSILGAALLIVHFTFIVPMQTQIGELRRDFQSVREQLQVVALKSNTEFATTIKSNGMRIEALENSVFDLSKNFRDHVVDPNIHHSGFKEFESRVTKLENRLLRWEQRPPSQCSDRATVTKIK